MSDHLPAPAGAPASTDGVPPEFRQAVLDSMSDGVMTIGTDGTVTAINPAGAAILGLDPDEVVGMPFAAVFFELPDNDAFTDTVLEAIQAGGGHAGGRRVVAFTRADGGVVTLSLSTALLTRHDDPDGERLGIVCVYSDVSELNALREAEQALARKLEDQNRQLVAAYRDLESSKAALEATAKRVQVWRIAVTGFAFVLFGGLGYYSWHSSAPGSRSLAVEAPPPTPGGDGFTLAPRPIHKSVSLAGTIEAGHMVGVVAPFAGTIRERMFEYGARVAAGDPLVIVDPGELNNQHRDAQSAVIKAEQKVEELRNWEHGAEVQRAKRQLQRSEQQYASARQKAAETKMLLDMGVVARQEYQSQADMERDYKSYMESARDDLAAARERGNAEAKRVAEFELANARFKLADIEAKLNAAKIRAPTAGVVIRPPQPQQGTAAAQPEVEAGVRLSEGQALLAIGSLDTLKVTAALPEIDINTLRVGLPVTVTSEAFPGTTLQGRVVAIANQAVKDQQSPLPAFPVTILIDDIPANARDKVRLGMSARLQVVIHDNPKALVIPPSFLAPGPNGYAVRRRDPATQAVETVPVALGERLPEGIEVTAGLSPGDVLLPP